MIAILNSLSFRLQISVSSGLISGYLSFFFWFGNFIYFFILLDGMDLWLCVVVVFDCRFHLPPSGVGQQLHILSPLQYVAQLPGAELGYWEVGRGAFSCTISGASCSVLAVCSPRVLA